MNFYENLTWKKMLCANPGKSDFDIKKYYRILSPDFPDFLWEYINVPSMQRLKEIGLLCGTDFTRLYQNRFYYSRLDHSIGVALITWNFTKNKMQTLASLFHDISTPIFSHVNEFRKGDALTQTDSENLTEQVILSDKKLCALLERDGFCIKQVCDYHLYPICDNERPRLSADRLEYMFPSGASLENSWKLSEIEKVYNDISILKNEDDQDELGFKTLEIAEFYTEKFLQTGHILQLNENKLALQFLGQITEKAIELKIISEADCLVLGEKQALEKFHRSDNAEFLRMLNTFENMTEVLHEEEKVFSGDEYFGVSLKVKQRYINPLVLVKGEEFCVRVDKASEKARLLITDFLSFEDKKYGFVKLI